MSYYYTNAQDTDWKHTTTFVVPANTLVHVTIFQYDSPTGLRNNFLGQAEGTGGGTMQLDGKTVNGINPNLTSHVFAVPQLGLSVPLAGISSNAKNPCGNAPCTMQQAHTTTTFTFRTGAKGLYRWQCFVPCGAGYIQGLGGPMQTEGYMDGYLKVV